MNISQKYVDGLKKLIMKMAGKSNGISLKEQCMVQVRGMWKNYGHYMLTFLTACCSY